MKEHWTQTVQFRKQTTLNNPESDTESPPLAASLAYFGINNGFLPVWWQESILSFQGNIYMVDKSNLQQRIIVYLSVIFCYNT